MLAFLLGLILGAFLGAAGLILYFVRGWYR